MAKRPFAVWLLPQQQREQALAVQMRALFARYHTPAFAPHMTLLGGHTNNLEEVHQRLSEALAEFRPVTLDVMGLAHSEAYFMTFFIKLAINDVLRGMCEQMRAALDPSSPYQLRPHISLIYAEMNAERRALLSEDITLDATPITFDRAALVYPANEEHGWNAIESWRTMAIQPLPPQPTPSD